MQPGGAEPTKSPEAFRTISEVATDLDVPQHVLRFWESRFNQIKPVKRAGARRYYRPEDVDLIRGIRALLYTEGFTIKGAQKILRDRGARYVAEIGRGQNAPHIHSGKRTKERAPKDETYRQLRAVDFSEEPLPGKKHTGPAEAIPEQKATPTSKQKQLFPEASPPKALTSQKRAKLEGLLTELLAMKAELRQTRRAHG